MDSSSASSDHVEEWERGLPSADDLIPLSQLLICPQLASAFSVSPEPTRTLLDVQVASQTTISSLRDSPEPRSKKRRLAWTPHLHKRFVEVVKHLGVHNAVPKTIMQMMNVEGLTRENVASHLQKYRAFLKAKEVGENPEAAASAASAPSLSVSIPGYGGGSGIMHSAVGHPYVVYGDRQRERSSGNGSSRDPNGISGDGM